MAIRMNGLEWDVEHGTTVQLRLTLDPETWGRLVPYQLRMMQEQTMGGRLLPVTAGEENGRLVLHYELAGHRRLVQRLYAEPPGVRMAVEMAHALVRAVAGCKAYMLQETGFLLHEDFVYADRKPTDFKLCYLPVEGAMEGYAMPPAAHQLRLLLLRVLASVREPLPAGMAPVFGLLSQETYSVAHLEQALRKLRYGGTAPDADDRERNDGEKSRKTGAFRIIADWLRKEGKKGKETEGRMRNRKQEHPPAKRAAAGDKTGLLIRDGDRESAGGTAATRLVFVSGERTETAVMEGERFLIGRNAGSVHYVIDREEVSRIHCEIVRAEDGLAVTDLGSLNGTLLNGQPMLPYKPYPFRHGDVLQVTGTTIRLAEPGEPIPEAAVLSDSSRKSRRKEANRWFPSRGHA